jgi:hypothetical protein
MKGTIVQCPHGHSYKYIDKLPNDWPEGAPLCPLCCKNWVYSHPTKNYIEKLKMMSKIRKILEKTYVGNGLL